MTKIKKVIGIHTVACEMAKLAGSTGVVIPEEQLLKITIEAEGKLPDDIAESLEDADVSEAIVKAVTEAAEEIRDRNEDEDEVSEYTTETKTGGSTMSGKNKTYFKPDYVDALMAVKDKTATLTGGDKVAANHELMNAVLQDLPGAVTAGLVKLSALQDFVVKYANLVEQVAEDVGVVTGKDYPKADTELQDEAVKDAAPEGELEDHIQVDGDGTGRTVMKGDHTGKESSITTDANKGSGAVSPNKKTTVGDVIAASKTGSASLSKVLTEIKKKTAKK